MMDDVHEMTRRAALKLGMAGAAGLYAMRAHPALAAAAPRRPHAKSVIQIWLWGGPCHLDTFDPKPTAGRDYCGPYTTPLSTNVAGMRIGERLPLLAKQADKYSIIRSMTHGINGHETASYRTQTGHEPGRRVYPCLGALVSKMRGREQGYKGVVAPYIVLTRPQGRFSEQGFLGDDHKPFSTGGDPNRTPFVVEGLVSPGVTDARQRQRRHLVGQLDALGRTGAADPSFKPFDAATAQAYEMMFGDARKLFDLTSEKEAVRDAYGRHTFGQSCLMARRLVEQGVPYITINYQGWDTHKQHFQKLIIFFTLVSPVAYLYVYFFQFRTHPILIGKFAGHIKWKLISHLAELIDGFLDLFCQLCFPLFQNVL